MKNKWTLTNVESITEIKGRGQLLEFIPKSNGIEFENIAPFRAGDIMIYESKEYDILAVEAFARAFKYDTEIFGFLIKSL